MVWETGLVTLWVPGGLVSLWIQEISLPLPPLSACKVNFCSC